MPMMGVKKATRQKARYISLSTTDVLIRNPVTAPNTPLIAMILQYLVQMPSFSSFPGIQA
jgi:hypothetical protein